MGWVGRGGGGGGGGTPIFSYIRRLGSFLGFEILNLNILGGGGGVQNSFFLGGGCMKILWIFFVG